MKKIFTLLALLIILTILPAVSAKAMESDAIQEQLESAGASDLADSLPQESSKLLEQAYQGGFSIESMQNLELGGVLNALAGSAKEQMKNPLNALIFIVGLIILCAVLGGMKEGLASGSMGTALSFMVSLAMSAVLILPVKEFMDKASQTIEGANVFLYAYVPVYAAAAASAGEPLSAASYTAVTLGAAELISTLISTAVLPLMGIFLGVSLIASLSDGFKLEALAAGAESCVKWLLGILATVFTGVLTVKSVVAGAGDSLSLRSAKFVVSTFVPIAGSTLGDSLAAVCSGMKYIKGTIGAFGLIAGGFIFIPIIMQNLLWMACVGIGSYTAEIFGVGEAAKLLKTVGSVLRIMLTLLLFVVMIMIISTAVLLITGGGGANG
ncbi:MAG: stage III sporulation protein AE [Oscillospiraceae bacterium]|jgi:stage III sporulation protein AE|nr:stage III sporulation protein AE [Oscillospiraceae bacterium]